MNRTIFHANNIKMSIEARQINFRKVRIVDFGKQADLLDRRHLGHWKTTSEKRMPLYLSNIQQFRAYRLWHPE